MSVLAAGPLLVAGSSAGRLLAAEDTDKAGPLGLLVLIVLIVACYFLFKSMSKHLRRVREDFPPDRPVDPPAERVDHPLE